MIVLGNGESRALIDVNLLDDEKIGCNAIMRDFKVDHLVCVDKRMLQEAITSSYHKHAKIYTRKDWFVRYRLEKNIRMVPELPYQGTDRWDNPFHWGSGPYAVLLGALKASHVKMIGFDLYSANKNVNNIYKGTENYQPINSRAVDPRYWIYQIGKVFEIFPHVKFQVYSSSDWNCPTQWKKSNVIVDSISNI